LHLLEQVVAAEEAVAELTALLQMVEAAAVQEVYLA
jgi:hypothetical protein